MIHEVIISKRAEKQLRKLPVHIVIKLQAWVEGIKSEGLLKIRHIPGFHDEPLKGSRQGQRSIRLSKAYRAIYVMNSFGKAQIVEVIEVNKHEY